MKDTFKNLGALLLIGAAKSFATTGGAVLSEKAGGAKNPFAVTGWNTAAGAVATLVPVLDVIGAELVKKLQPGPDAPAPVATYTAP